MEWQQITYDEFTKRAKKWNQKRRYTRELKAMLSNYETIVETLSLGANPDQIIKFGFVHPEPKGMWAIDQKGAGPGVAETRMYVFAEKENKTLHVFTIGTKETQESDIRNCVSEIDGLLAKVGDK